MDIVEFNDSQFVDEILNDIQTSKPEESQQIPRDYDCEDTIHYRCSGLFTDIVTFANISRAYGLDINSMM